MRVLLIVHQADAGPGVFAQVAGTRGIELVEWRSTQGPAPGDALHGYDAALVLGASANPDEDVANPWLREVRELLGGFVDREIPTLGICLGAELLAQAAGGTALQMAAPEIGWVEIGLTREATDDPVVGPLPDGFPSFQWHGWGLELPPGGVALSRERERLNAFRVGEAWGLQFHPEVTNEMVTAWLDDYASDAAAVAAGFNPEPVVAETPERIAPANEVGRRIFGAFLDYAARTRSRTGSRNALTECDRPSGPRSRLGSR